MVISVGCGFLCWLRSNDQRHFRPAYHWRWFCDLLDCYKTMERVCEPSLVYILVALTGIFILPELYCLYAQFDAHPEKMVFGQTGVSGLNFFLG